MKDKNERSIVKRTLAGVGLGQLVHFGMCPMHGLPALLIKTGLVSGAIAAPFVAVHDYISDNIVRPCVAYVRDDSRDYSSLPPMRYDVKTRSFVPTDRNKEIAHDIVDYSGWALALGIPLIMLGTGVYRRRNHSRKNENIDPAERTYPVPEEII